MRADKNHFYLPVNKKYLFSFFSVIADYSRGDMGEFMLNALDIEQLPDDIHLFQKGFEAKQTQQWDKLYDLLIENKRGNKLLGLIAEMGKEAFLQSKLVIKLKIILGINQALAEYDTKDFTWVLLNICYFIKKKQVELYGVGLGYRLDSDKYMHRTIELLEVILTDDANRESIEKRKVYFILQILLSIHSDYEPDFYKGSAKNIKPDKEVVPYAIKILTGLVCSHFGFLRTKAEYFEENSGGLDYKGYLRKRVENTLDRKVISNLPDIIPEYELYVL